MASQSDDDLPVGGTPRPGAVRSRPIGSNETETVRVVKQSVPSVHDEPQATDVDLQKPPVAHPRREPQSRVRRPNTTRQPQRPKSTFKVGEKKLSDRVFAASQRPGFIARGLTVFVLYAVLTFLVFTVLSGPIQITTLLVLFAVVLYTIKLFLDSADKPLPQVPEGAILPTEGQPRIYYWVVKLYGYPNKVPQLTTRQRLQEETKLYEERLREVARFVQPTIWVGNEKGQSCKSFLSVVGGNIVADVLRRIVFLLFASANTTTGTAGKLSGLKGKTLTVWQYYSRISEFVNPWKLYGAVNSTKYGLRVVSEDPGGGHKEGYFKAAQFDRIYANARSHAEVLVLDTGNDGATSDSVTIAGLNRAGVAIITGLASNPQSLSMITETMEEYLTFARQSNPGHTMPAAQRAIGEHIPLDEKILQSIVVINGLRPGEDLDKYQRYVDLGQDGTGNPVFQGMMFGIGWDDYLDQVTENLDHRKMANQTYRDYLVVYVAAFEQAARLLGITVPERHPALVSGAGLTVPYQA